MSLWKGGTRKTKKTQNSTLHPRPQQERPFDESSAAVLPDVIAGLSLGSPDNRSGVSASVEEENMFNYGFNYPEEQQRGRNRVPRPRRGPQNQEQQPPTPYGLGAACFVQPQHNYDASNQCYATQGYSGINANAHLFDASINPPSEGFHSVQNAHCSMSNANFHELRVRSMSSDPYRNETKIDQRTRCLSATRTPQPRCRKKLSKFVLPPNESSLLNSDHSFGQNRYRNIDNKSSASQRDTVDGNRYMKKERVPNEVRESFNGIQAPHNNTMAANNNYGYQISDLEGLLSESSPNKPANLPMVLASSSRLYNMRRSQETQSDNHNNERPFLPLGIIVNAVFKTREWLYIRTAHGAEGYVPFRVCLPLGILPQRQSTCEMSTNVPNINSTTSPWEFRGNETMCSLFRDPKLENPQPRGRSRVRRRPPNSTTNQTDIQKLQPPQLQNSSDIRMAQQNNFDNQTSGNPSYIPYLV